MGDSIWNVDIADMDFLGNEMDTVTASMFEFNEISMESYSSDNTVFICPTQVLKCFSAGNFFLKIVS